LRVEHQLCRPSSPPSKIQEALRPTRPPFSLPSSNLQDATFPGAPSNVVSEEQQSGIQQFLSRSRRHSRFESSNIGVGDGRIDSIPKSAIMELLQASHRRTHSASQDKKRKRLDSFLSST
jgi:hypothetical protein